MVLIRIHPILLDVHDFGVFLFLHYSTRLTFAFFVQLFAFYLVIYGHAGFDD